MANTIRGGAFIYGIVVVALTVLFAVPLGLLSALGNTPFIMSGTVVISMLALGVTMGGALAGAGWRSYTRKTAVELHMPPAWALLIAFLASLAVGTLVLRTPLSFLLPLIHLLACVLPPLVLIAAVARYMQARGLALTRRDLASQFAYGAVGATAVAITLESLAAVAVMILGIVGATLVPGGAESMQTLSEAMQSPLFYTSPERLLDYIFAPALVASLALLVAVVTPMIEEVVKSLGVPLAAALRPVSRGQAFAFGMIAGAGFSLTEALFYGLAELPHNWAVPVLTRAATVVIHGAATGLMGVAWYEALHRRTGRFILYAAGGIGLHALWNALGGLLAVTSLNMLGDSGSLGAALGTGLSALAIFLLAATWFLALGVIIWQARRGVQEPAIS